MSEINENALRSAGCAVADMEGDPTCIDIARVAIIAYEAAKPAPSPSGEMVEESHINRSATGLVAELRDACFGHPSASIAWPHRVLHRAADAIELADMREGVALENRRKLSAALRAAEALVSQQAGELERVKGERDVALANHASCTILWEQDRGRAEAALTKSVEAERAPLLELVSLLQEDLAKLSDVHERCEGCGAPIADDEDACTAADVVGCWAYTADTKGAPCWRYRTKNGMDRAWPECAPAAAIRSRAQESETGAVSTAG